VPFYDLSLVRKAVKSENIKYAGRTVQRDISNLGYELDDVLNCLSSITERDFFKTNVYQGIEHDAYKVCYNKVIDGRLYSDVLYVKFFIKNGTLTLTLASFHVDR
jgi:hypothetical protein